MKLTAASVPLLLVSMVMLPGCDLIEDEITDPEYEESWIPGPPDLRGRYELEMMLIAPPYGEVSLDYSLGNANNTGIALNVEVIAGAWKDDQLLGEVRQYVGSIASGHTLNGGITIPVSASPTSDYCRVWWDDSEGYSYYIDLDRRGVTYPMKAGLHADRSGPGGPTAAALIGPISD